MRRSLRVLCAVTSLSVVGLFHTDAEAEFIRPAESICGIDARPGLQWFKCEVHAGFQFKDTGEIYNCIYRWTNQQSTNGTPANNHVFFEGSCNLVARPYQVKGQYSATFHEAPRTQNPYGGTNKEYMGTPYFSADEVNHKIMACMGGITSLPGSPWCLDLKLNP